MLRGEPKPVDGESYQLYRIGRDAMKAELWQEALEAFRQSFMRKPHSRTLERMGRCFVKLEMWSRAQLCFRVALGENPRSYNVLCLIASTLMATGDHDQAEKELRRAIRLHPAARPAWELRDALRENRKSRLTVDDVGRQVTRLHRPVLNVVRERTGRRA